MTGTVRLRPEGTVNPDLGTGEVEVGDCRVEVLNEAEPPPFSVDDRAESDEPVRLRYRYVDLRRPRMQRNLRLRARVNTALRAAMVRQGFVEIETPLLWAPTPEGSREFSVPSRLHHGSFYALPQSPQLAKQLLMVGGFDRYFQIARCLRDEDLRADRQFEFSQLDLECSFASQDDVMAFVSEAVLDAAEAATGERPPPIERMTWADALDRYGTDKPDLRFGMELVDLTPTFAGHRGQGLQLADGQGHRRCPRAPPSPLQARRADRAGQEGGRRRPGLVPGHRRPRASTVPWPVTSPRPRRPGCSRRPPPSPGDLDPRRARRVPDRLRGAGSVAHHPRLAAGQPGPAPLRLGRSTSRCSRVYGADGHPQAAHHPFTMPYPEDLPKLASDPLAVRSQAYDLVLNGWELGSGSVRIHRSDIQSQVFAALGISEEEAEARFGFLLGAFRYGAPPHAGFAVGVDRLAAVLAGEENIREVIAYPKTQSGADLLTGAPTPLPAASLAELGIRVVVPPAAPGQAGAGRRPRPVAELRPAATS